MAQSTIYFKVQNDSSANFEESTSNLLQLFKGATSYVGNSETDPNFDYVGKGVWGIGVNVNDSGVYTVKKTTDAGGSYTVVGGLATVPILMKDMLMLAGGTMSGDIAMANNKITGLGSVSFNDASGTIHGIAAKNLLDKTATEAITGDWSHSGDNTFTGALTVATPSNFKLGGVSLDDSLTGNDLNMLANLYTTDAKVLTSAVFLGAVQTTVLVDQVLTFAKAGLIVYGTDGANRTCTMPLLTKGNAGAMFIIYLDAAGSYSLTIERNAADAGFVLMTGALTTVTGTKILLDANGDFVILMCSGVPNGRWAIISGNNADLS